MRDFWYYGLRLSTDLPLAGLPRWPGVDGAADLVLREGAVPETLDDSPRAGRLLSVGRDGTALVYFKDLLKIIVRAGGAATIEISPGARMVDVEGYLLSFIAGVVLHQRGMLPLHASCVVVDGQAIAISGRSGRGKSTLAAAFARKGRRLLSDDITVIRFSADGDVLAVPGSPHVRLNSDSLCAAGLDPARVCDGRRRDEKKIWRREAAEFAPIRLSALFRLEVDPEAQEPRLERLFGPGAVLPLQELVYRFGLGRRLGRGGELAFGALRLAGKVPIHRLVRPQGFDALEAALEKIIGAL